MNDASPQLSLLKVQIGPVQDFIAQARSTRDLWSGSYLLSWLVAAGLSQLDDDCVIYPSVKEQPMMKLRRKTPDDRKNFSEDEMRTILTPNMPSILVASVSTSESEALAKKVADAISCEWLKIAKACWHKALADTVVREDQQTKFDAQVQRFLSVTWQVTAPVFEDDTALLQSIPLDERQRTRLAFEPRSLAHRYALQYLLNGWQLDAVRQTRGFNAWREGGWDAGVEQNKDTLTGKEEMLVGGKEWWKRRRESNRHDKLWPILLREKHDGDFIGAITLIKRTWHWAYLAEAPWHLTSLHTSEACRAPTQFPFPSTFQIASHDPTKTEHDEERETSADAHRLGSYFAVLALDGDSIGQWVGGGFTALTAEHHREFSERLSAFALHCVRPIVTACDGRLIYAGGDDVLALLPADTALDCARYLRMAFRGDTSFIVPLRTLAKQLVARHEGKDRTYKQQGDHSEEIAHMLINVAEEQLFVPHQSGFGICGGDEALALPGGLDGGHFYTSFRKDRVLRAIAMRDHLRCIGSRSRSGAPCSAKPKKWLDRNCAAKPLSKRSRDPVWVLKQVAITHELHPDASVGIAIAHFKSPLQDVIRAAQAAERRAKTTLGRSAMSVTMMKRSGEILDWGCQWASRGFALAEKITAAMTRKKLSAKFPHRVCGLLEPYLTARTGLMHDVKTMEHDVLHFDAVKVITSEFNHAIKQQGEAALSHELIPLLKHYLASVAPHDRLSLCQSQLQAVIGLCRTVAFTYVVPDASPEYSAERQPE